MAGKKATPTHLKVIRGNPGKRAISKKEPKPKKGIPRCPTWLSPKAKTAFKGLCISLDDCGLLTKLDGSALELLCETYSEWRDACFGLKKKGSEFYETTTKDGGKIMRPHPLVSQRSDSARRLQSLYREFGMTPSARSGLNVNEPGDKEPTGWDVFS